MCRAKPEPSAYVSDKPRLSERSRWVNDQHEIQPEEGTSPTRVPTRLHSFFPEVAHKFQQLNESRRDNTCHESPRRGEACEPERAAFE